MGWGQAGGLGTWQTKLGWGGAVKMFFVACCLHRALNIWLILIGIYGSYHWAVDCIMVGIDGVVFLQAAHKLVQVGARRERRYCDDVLLHARATTRAR